jgi:cytochrome P450
MTYNMAAELDHSTFSSSSEHGDIQIADWPPGAQYGNFIRMDPPRHTAQRKTVAGIPIGSATMRRDCSKQPDDYALR